MSGISVDEAARRLCSGRQAFYEDCLLIQGQRRMNHPSRDELIKKFEDENKSNGGTSLNEKPNDMVEERLMQKYFITNNYPPCHQPLSKLKRISFCDLRIETHHVGCVLYVRTITNIVENAGLLCLVDDSNDNAERLVLYNHPPVATIPMMESCVIALKQPYYEMISKNDCIIRMDHWSDIVPLYEGDSRIPPEMEITPNQAFSGSDLLGRGSEAMKRGDYASAVELLREALSKADNPLWQTNILSTRGQAYLCLLQFDLAHRDSLAALMLEPANVCALYVKASALYGLRNFDLCKKVLDEVLNLAPDHPGGLFLKGCTAKSIKERDSGTYSFVQTFRDLRVDERPTRDRAASFTKLTEVKAAGSRGRGLFAKERFRMGDLIMCEKALFLVEQGNEKAVQLIAHPARGWYEITYGPSIHRIAVSEAFKNAFIRKRILDLYDGGYAASQWEGKQVDQKPVLDSFRIHEIVRLNNMEFHRGLKEARRDEGVGLWAQASYINHSCMPNAIPSSMGDTIIFRAVRDIAAGEEITRAYAKTTNMDVRDRRGQLQEGWGFLCECPLCEAELQISDQILNIRMKFGEGWQQRHKGWYENYIISPPYYEDSDDWRQAPRTLRDLWRLILDMENTYDKKAFATGPRLAAANWGVSLLEMMPGQVWPTQKLEVAGHLLRNFGWFLRMEGNKVKLDSSNAVFPEPQPEIIVDTMVVLANCYNLIGRDNIAEGIYHLAKTVFGLYCAEPDRFDEEHCTASGEDPGPQKLADVIPQQTINRGK